MQRVLRQTLALRLTLLVLALSAMTGSARAQGRAPLPQATPSIDAPQLPTATQKIEQPLDPERYEWGLLPALTYSSDIGFGFGAIVTLARFSQDARPYRWRLEVLWLMTVKEKPGGDGYAFPFHNDYIKLDVPGLFDGRLRLNAELTFSRFTTSGYFGFGNAAPSDLAAREKNPHYHMVDRIYPIANLRARIRLTRHLQTFVGARYIYNWLNPYAGSLFAHDLHTTDPATRRLLRGTGHYGVVEGIVGWIWDSRDHEYRPRHGMFHELSWRFSPGAAIGTDHAYGGINLTLRAYHALLGSYLILAGRLMADLLVGAPPYYELAQHGGLFPNPALGGGRGIRGVARERYFGKIKLLGDLELRSRFIHFTIKGQRFQVGAVAFFDTGRTWADWSGTAHLDGDGLGLKWGTGGGLRLFWGETFVIRADVAYSPDADPVGIYIDVNHCF